MATGWETLERCEASRVTVGWRPVKLGNKRWKPRAYTVMGQSWTSWLAWWGLLFSVQSNSGLYIMSWANHPWAMAWLGSSSGSKNKDIMFGHVSAREGDEQR